MKTQTSNARRINRVAITRSKTGNAELARKLDELGFEPILVDTIDFLPPENWSRVDANLLDITKNKFDWVIFTSPTGVRFFKQRMRELGLSISAQGFPALAAVGSSTALALKEHGLDVGFVPSEYLTSTLAHEIPKNRGRRALVLRADIGDPSFTRTLESEGFEVEDVIIYRTIHAERRRFAVPSLHGADSILFASPSAVEAVSQNLGKAEKLLPTVCIGPVTAVAARKHGFSNVVVAKDHTLEGLIDALVITAKEEKAGC